MARTQIPGPRRTARAAAVLAAAALLLIGLPAGASPSPDASTPRAADVRELIESARAASGATGADEPLRYIVELDDAATPSGQIGALSEADRRAGIAARGAEVRAALDAIGVDVARDFDTVPYLAVSADAEDLAALLTTPGVRSVVPDEVVELQLDQSVPRIGASNPTASYAGSDLRGDGVAVAVIDTGVDTSHPFIGPGRVVAEACFSSRANCPNGTTEDRSAGAGGPLGSSDHGTHVAGIAIGAGDGSPAQGVAPDADLIAIQAFSLDDEGNRISFASDLVKSLEFVLDKHTGDNDVEVAAVNLSLGTGPQSPCNDSGSWTAFAEVATDLRAAGVLTIAASGNNGSRDTMSAPACLPEVVSVTAVDNADEVASFSNVSDETDLVAPGVGIVSSVLDGSFGTKSGTSMAAPHVAGTAALLRQGAPWADPGALLAALTSAASSVDDDRSETTIGSDETAVTDTAGSVDGLPLLDVPYALTSLPGAPDAPGAPTGVTATDEGDQASTVSWHAPSTGPAPTGYHVISRPDGKGCSTQPATDTTCDVEGLVNGTAYTFTVLAVTDRPGPSSSPSDPVTPVAGPPTAPQNVTARATDGAAVVTWSASVTGEKPVTAYTIAAADDTSANAPGCSASEVDGSVATECEVTGLDPDHAYRFTVVAESDAGSSPLSEPSNTVTPNGRPDPPTDVTAQAGDAEVSVSWTPPAWEGGDALLGYEVISSPTSEGCTVDLSQDTAATGCTVDGLTNGTIYTFTVVARNINGDSPPSAPTPERRPATVPGPPTITDVASTSAGEATVTLEAPASDGGSEILSYRVEASSAGGSCEAEPPPLDCTITGLSEGGSYSFTATATNDRGTSEVSPASEPVLIMSSDAGGDDGGDDQGDGGGGGLAGGSGGGGLPPAEEGDGAGDDDEPAPATDPDGSLPSQDPGTSTLLLDGQATQADVIVAGSTVTVSGPDFSLTLSASTPAGVAEEPDGDAWPHLSPGGQLGVAFGGLLGGSSAHGWLFSEPVLLGSATASAAGNIDAAWTVPTTIAGGAHTLQVNGTLADGRSITFNLGIDVEAAISFPDVDPDATHGQAILRLAQLGIVTGFSDGTFGPALPVNRGQMASFLQRALELEPGESGAFPDTAGGTHDLAISAIAAADIATGFEDGTYRPGEPVTRGQMATFLANAVELVEAPDGPFIDIDGNVHAGRINAVAAAGIAEGFDDDTYRPGLDITRAQMASLISRMLDHLAQAA